MELRVEAADLEPRSNTDRPEPSLGSKVRLLTMKSLDGRTLAARRAKQLLRAIESDLGGEAYLSEGEKQLAQRAAVLGAFIESCEAAWLGGAQVELAEYLAAINSQRRVLATIGLQRRPREAALDLRTHLAAKVAEEAEP